MFENLVKYTSSSCQSYTLLYWNAKKVGIMQKSERNEKVKVEFDNLLHSYALCSCLLKENLKWDISQTGSHSVWQIFLLKDVAHWSSQSFHWLLWKKFHLLCSTLKKKVQNLNLWKTKKACFLRRGSFFFLGMCSFWIHAAWKYKVPKSVHFPCACQVVHNSNSTLWKIYRVLQGIMVCHREYEYLSVSVEQLSSFHFVFVMAFTLGSHILLLIFWTVHGSRK